MNKETKLRIHNITAKAALKFGSEAWVLKKREEKCLEAVQMKTLRNFLGKKTRKRKESKYQGKNGCTEYSKGNKIVPEKVATTRTEDGHKQNPKQALQYKPKGRKNIGRPRKRWRDQLHLED